MALGAVHTWAWARRPWRCNSLSTFLRRHKSRNRQEIEIDGGISETSSRLKKAKIWKTRESKNHKIVDYDAKVLNINRMEKLRRKMKWKCFHFFSWRLKWSFNGISGLFHSSSRCFFIVDLFTIAREQFFVKKIVDKHLGWIQVNKLSAELVLKDHNRLKNFLGLGAGEKMKNVISRFCLFFISKA